VGKSFWRRRGEREGIGKEEKREWAISLMFYSGELLSFLQYWRVF